MVQAFNITIRKRIGPPMTVVMVNKDRAIRAAANWSVNPNVLSISVTPCEVDGMGRLVNTQASTPKL